MPERPLASVHRLTIAVTLFTAIIVIGLLTIGKSKFHYKVSKEEMISKILAADYLVSPESAKAILSQDNVHVKFVDLRNKYDFNLGHVKDALNIPTHKLLDKESLALFKDTTFTYILYGAKELDANGPWMVLSQMGFPNFKVLKGGYETYVSGEAVANRIYPYDKILTEAEAEVGIAKLQSATEGKAKAKKKVKVIPRKVVVKEEEEEGC